MRFGLYWTDDLDMVGAAGRQQRAARIRRLFDEYGADHVAIRLYARRGHGCFL